MRCKILRSAVLLWFVSASLPLFPQTTAGPSIEKVEPPNWYIGLPDPMLLVRGRNLAAAKFRVNGNGVRVVRSQVSTNGHWALLWLATQHAAPQNLVIDVSTPSGDAKLPFALGRRNSNSNAHAGFSSADVMYLVMTDRFADGNLGNNQPGYDRSATRGWHGGDLAGINQHLDYLRQLGITILWTTPVASNGDMPDSYHGYAATDMYEVDRHFGSVDDYRNLSAALHRRGMKLVIDFVPNHIGVQHPWVTDPPTPDWLHGTVAHHHNAEHDFAQLLDPHAPEHAWFNITHGWFTDSMPDLNQENPDVKQYLIQNALWWIETANLDGIRLDTFPYVDRAFWRDFHAAIHAAYPRVTTVGEVFNADPEITSFFAGGRERNGIDTGLDTPFDFPVYFKLREVLTGDKPMTDLESVFRHDELYPHPERLVTFIGNHDTSRFITAANGSAERLKLAMGLLLTMRGMPQIYSGDEIAMSGADDPDNRHDFPGGFPGDAHDAFRRAGRTAAEQEMFAWTSALIELRKQHAVLQTGLQEDEFANADVFAYLRAADSQGCAKGAGERLLVIANKSDRTEPVELDTERTALAGCRTLDAIAPASGPEIAATKAKFLLQQPADSLAVYAVH